MLCGWGGGCSQPLNALSSSPSSQQKLSHQCTFIYLYLVISNKRAHPLISSGLSLSLSPPCKQFKIDGSQSANVLERSKDRHTHQWWPILRPCSPNDRLFKYTIWGEYKIDQLNEHFNKEAICLKQKTKKMVTLWPLVSSRTRIVKVYRTWTKKKRKKERRYWAMVGEDEDRRSNNKQRDSQISSVLTSIKYYKSGWNRNEGKRFAYTSSKWQMAAIPI